MTKLSFTDLALDGELTVASWRRFEWHPEYPTTLDEILDQRPWYQTEVGTRCICTKKDAPYSYCPRCGWRYGLLPDGWEDRAFELTGALIARLDEFNREEMMASNIKGYDDHNDEEV